MSMLHCTRLRIIFERSQSLQQWNDIFLWLKWVENNFRSPFRWRFVAVCVHTPHERTPKEKYLFQWLWQWAVHVLFLILFVIACVHMSHSGHNGNAYKITVYIGCRRWEIWIHSTLFYSALRFLFIYLFPSNRRRTAHFTFNYRNERERSIGLLREALTTNIVWNDWCRYRRIRIYCGW